MQTDLPLPMLQPFIQLTQANMALFTSARALTDPAELLHGMTMNCVAFVTELSRGAWSAFAGSRGGFVALAREL